MRCCAVDRKRGLNVQLWGESREMLDSKLWTDIMAVFVAQRTPAQVAELVDALGSGPSGGNIVEVRVLSWAPYLKRPALAGLFSLFRPGSKVPTQFAWGLERLRLQQSRRSTQTSPHRVAMGLAARGSRCQPGIDDGRSSRNDIRRSVKRKRLPPTPDGACWLADAPIAGFRHRTVEGVTEWCGESPRASALDRR